MANFSTADVKRLRDATGAGMMDCKRALDEADGDYDKAIEMLRIKGAKDIGKRADRTAAQGLVAASGGAMIELACETDFVAKNAEFQALADQIVQAVVDGATDVESALIAPLGTGTVADAINVLSSKIGEKLELRHVVKYEGATSTYLHRRSADLPPAIGVLLQYQAEDAAAGSEAAKAAAMQVASLKARFVSRDEIPADIVETERRIAEATAREEGKPEGALPKIIEGRLNGFFKDVVLLEQSSVLDTKKTVGKLLAEAGVTVSAFSRFEVGQA